MKIYRFSNPKQQNTALHSSLAEDIRLIAEGIDRADNMQQVKLLIDSLYEKANLVEQLLETPLAPCRPHKKELVFFASPYSADSMEQIRANLTVSLQATAYLMQQGFDVYNPLAHGSHIHGFIERYDMSLANTLLPYNAWHELNCRIMESCDAMVWLHTSRTPHSEGMKAEIAFARQLNLPILGLYYEECRFKFYTEEQCGNLIFPVTAAAK